MFSDGVVALAEAGVINNSKKTLHPGKYVANFLMGTKRLYDFVDHNPDVLVLPVDYVNHPVVAAKNDNLVSINSCVQVDLMGQNRLGEHRLQADLRRGRPGGLHPGRRLLQGRPGHHRHALHRRQGHCVQIVPLLDEGAAVTTSRNDVDYVVTEYGIAHLKGHTLRDRARALIEIAHPDFQDGLKEEFEKRFHCAY